MKPSGVRGAWLAGFLSRPVSNGLPLAPMVAKVYPRRASTRAARTRYVKMETRLTLRPGRNGTCKLAERFGKRLVRVRYRYDETLRKLYTMVELIVAESACE